MKTHPDKLATLNDVIPYLMISYPFIPDIGLLYGKMGGVLLFNHYAKYTGKDYFFDYAGDLFESIYNSLTENTPVNFNRGLCGIGWGVEYLLQHEFTEGNSDEILEDIDAKIKERDVRRITDMSFDTGLAGILLYVITRMESYDRQSKFSPFEPFYLHELQKRVNTNVKAFPTGWIDRLNEIVTGKTDFARKPLLSDILSAKVDVLPDSFEKMPVGIKDGLTGALLKTITEIR